MVFNNLNLKMIKFNLVCLFLCSLLVSNVAIALPWDTDLYNQQSLKSNEVARAPVKGTVPVGYKPFNMTIEEADGKITNPVKFDKKSVWAGQRLWNSQCAACHGVAGDSNNFIGKSVGSPNLLEPRFKPYSDGRIYATIVLGVRSMPRYGYKLSEAERWDIVNYLRFLQGNDVDGLKRPSSEK
jgi:mono/diheme cytochrome c family protein